MEVYTPPNLRREREKYDGWKKNFQIYDYFYYFLYNLTFLLIFLYYFLILVYQKNIKN